MITVHTGSFTPAAGWLHSPHHLDSFLYLPPTLRCIRLPSLITGDGEGMIENGSAMKEETRKKTEKDGGVGLGVWRLQTH